MYQSKLVKGPSDFEAHGFIHECIRRMAVAGAPRSVGTCLRRGACVLLCIFPVFVFMQPSAAQSVAIKTAFIQASDGDVYQIHFGESNNVRNFSVYDRDGYPIVPSNNVAIELYFAARSLNDLSDLNIGNRDAIATLAEERINQLLKHTRARQVIAASGFLVSGVSDIIKHGIKDALTQALSRPALISNFSSAAYIPWGGLNHNLKTQRVLKAQQQALLWDNVASEYAKHYAGLVDTLRSSVGSSAVISSDDITNAWESRYKASKLQAAAAQLASEQIEFPSFLRRLEATILSIPGIASLATPAELYFNQRGEREQIRYFIEINSRIDKVINEFASSLIIKQRGHAASNLARSRFFEQQRSLVNGRGVCNRTPQVRDAITWALRRARCDQVSSAQLRRVTTLDLSNKNVVSLQEENDFSGISNLIRLNLRGNQINDLPAGIFSGLPNLTSLDLRRNPGASFPVGLQLQTQGDDVAVKLSESAPFSNAPFNIRVNLSVRNGTLSSSAATIRKGQSTSETIRVTPARGGRQPVVSMRASTVPRNFRGISIDTSSPFTLFPDNSPPQAVGAIPRRTLTVGGSAATINLSNYFNDPDGDTLAYSAASFPSGKVTAAVSGNILTITPLSESPVVLIGLTARDPDRLLANQMFLMTIQGASACTYTLSPSSASFGSPGGNRSVSVTTGNNCSWTATSNNSEFLSIRSGSSGTGNGTVSYRVSSNNGATRLGSLNIGNRVFTVEQSGSQTAPDISGGICNRTQQVREEIIRVIRRESGTRLTCASVRDHHLEDIPDLNLGSESISSLQSIDFAGLSDMTELGLDNNQLAALSYDVFSDLNELEELTLHDNRLQSLPRDIFADLDDLQELSLYYNRLTTLPSGPPGVFHGLSRITSLRIDNNRLKTLPKGAFSGLSGLTTLRLQSNRLTTLSAGAFSGLSSLTRLDLYKNKLTTLPAGAFSGLSKLPRLDLSDQRLTTLSTDAFSGLSSLTELYLEDNQLTTLPAGAFSGLSNLTELDLDDNQLATLSAGAFSGLSNLTELDLDGNQLTTLPAGVFSGLSNLTELNLEDNQVTTLTAGVFSGLSNLTELELADGQLTTLSAGAFSGLSSLSALDLRNNRLTALPVGVFSGLSALRTLELDFNQLDTLPAGVFSGLSNLGRLELNHSRLTTLPAGVFSGLSGLTTLKLQSNQLKTLSAGVFSGLSNLMELDLDRNQLTTLSPGTFSGLSKLPKLDLNRQQLTTLSPDTFSGLSNLTELNLGRNQLTTLPAGVFSGPSSLTRLYLHYNQLTTLPADAFSGLPNLTQLLLHDNQVTTLTAGVFSGLSNLAYLNLEDNQLTTLSAAVFFGLSSLTGLDLKRNQLTTLPAGVFSGLPRLTQLSLSRNQLTTLPAGVFSGLPRLTRLSLSRNQLLGKLPRDVFSGLSNLAELHLDGNPGAPFTLTPILMHADNADSTTSDSVTLAVRLVEGAPFGMTLSLSASGGRISSSMVTIPTGSTVSSVFTVTRNDGESVSVSFGSVPAIPSRYYGIRVGTGKSLVLFPPRVILSESILTVNEGSSVTYTAALNTKPHNNVVVAVGSTSTDVTISPASLTFTSGNWSAKQAVAIHAIEDGDGESEMFTLNHTVTGYVNVSSGGTIAVTIRDDEGICGRTLQVRDALVAAVPGISDCADVTTAHLRATTGTLSLAGQDITALYEDDFADLVNLTGVDLSNNRLSKLPAGIFSGLFSLTRLYLSNNQLTALPESIFSDLPNLTELYLSGNRLDALPDAMFAKLPRLRTLYLHTNQLESRLLPKVFSNFSDLEYISLYNNQLTTLPKDTFLGVSRRLKTLSLHSNPESPFDLKMSLTRTDNTDLTVSGVATMAVQLAEGSPFDMSVGLSATGGLLSSGTTTILAGSTMSETFTVEQAGIKSVPVGLNDLEIPTTAYYNGIQFEMGESLDVFSNMPGVILSETTFAIVKGSTDTYSAVLNTQPSANATIMISSTHTDVSVASAMLTFTPSNWNVPQTVTVHVTETPAMPDKVAILKHAVTGYGSVSDGGTASVEILADVRLRLRVFLEGPLRARIGGQRAPTANAGGDQIVDEGSVVTLMGSGSDPEGEALSYSWVQISGTPRVSLSDATMATPTFTAPNLSASVTLEFSLTVTDASGAVSQPDSVAITITADSDVLTANAGRDQTVDGGSVVTLMGSGSDPEGEALSYMWMQISGSPMVSLSDATAATPIFTAPNLSASVTLEFSLTVMDASSNVSQPDSVVITITAEGTSLPARTLSFSGQTIAAQTYAIHIPIAPLTLPTASDGVGGTISYTLQPALPDGLSFDAAARVLSGTPTTATAATAYTYAAMDSRTTVALNFTIAVVPWIVGNLDQLQTDTLSAGTTRYSPFRTGSNPGGYLLNHVVFPSLAESSSIYPSAGNFPAGTDQRHQLTVPGATPADGNYTFTPSGRFVLSPNTIYYVSFSSNAQNTSVTNSAAHTSFAGWQLIRRVSFLAGSGWESDNSQVLRFRIAVTPLSLQQTIGR